jgi:glc operon protein GlcG
MYIESKKINVNGAKKLAALAQQEAEKHGVPGAIAIVDDGGNLVYAERWDNTMIAAMDIAINKAKTAIGFQRPTIAIEEVIANGRMAMLSLTNTVAYAPLKGGYPITVNGSIIGAIALAGTLNADLDETIICDVLTKFNDSK